MMALLLSAAPILFLFPEDSPLRRVRRHDLRHSAITASFNRGVTLKTAQRWSGHRTASVLLDTYLGVMRDDAELSLARVEGLLDEALAAGEHLQPWRAGDGRQGNLLPKEEDGEQG